MTQLQFCEPPIMFYEDVWVAHLRGVWGQLQAIEEQRKTLDEKEDDVNWLLGDQLVEGVEAGGKSKKLKKHVLQVTGRKLSDSRLNRLMTVSRAVEPCRRQQFLSWSMHAEVAKFEPEVQEKLLEEARDTEKKNGCGTPRRVGTDFSASGIRFAGFVTASYGTCKTSGKSRGSARPMQSRTPAEPPNHIRANVPGKWQLPGRPGRCHKSGLR